MLFAVELELIGWAPATRSMSPVPSMATSTPVES